MRVSPPYLAFLLLLLLTACSPTHTLTLEGQPQATTATRVLDAQPLQQTFTLARGTHEIELILALAPDAPLLPTRPLRWRLLNSGSQLLSEGVVETAGMAHNTPLWLRFAPITTTQFAELDLTAPPGSGLRLWASGNDVYPSGNLLNEAEGRGDLHFTLRAEERPTDLWLVLQEAARRWRNLVLWVPLLLLGPGWLLAWLLAPRDGRPLLPAVIALSLSLAPFVYLFTSTLGLRIYEPLTQSLMQASALALLLAMLRDPVRTARAWREAPLGPLVLLALCTLAGAATWLLAARALLAPPGVASLATGLLAQDMVRTGLPHGVPGSLPVAALSATLTQMSRQPISLTLLLGGVLLGVALLPSLYTLAEAVSSDAWAALWLVPLTWLVPFPWQALAGGNLDVLYSLTMTPLAVALGVRALHPVAQRRALVLATFPLVALWFVQGALAGGAWLLGVALALFQRARQGSAGPTERGVGAVIARGGIWLALAVLGGVPAWLKGVSFAPVWESALAAYTLVALVCVGAALMGLLGRRWPRLIRGGALLAIAAVPLLLWWRSVPLPPTATTLTQPEVELMGWAAESAPADARFLLNVAPGAAGFEPRDGGFWLPLFAQRATTLQPALPAALVTEAMTPNALAEPTFRQRLLDAGVTHVFLGSTPGPLRVDDLLNQPWARVAFQVGPVYIFELLGGAVTP